jgi:hypothetical protein
MVAEVSEIVILIYFNCDAMWISTGHGGKRDLIGGS